MSSAPGIEEGELPSSPDRGEEEDLEEGEILESDNEENGEPEARGSPNPPKLTSNQQERGQERERDESSQRNTRKGIEVWADFYQTSRSVPPQRANRHSDDSPYSDSDPDHDERSYPGERHSRYDAEEDKGRPYDREQRVTPRAEKPHEHQGRQRRDVSRAPKPTPRVTCKFWARGVCRKGDECEFAHEGMRLKKKELCKFYSSGVCGRGRDCLFLHSEFPCKFFHTGSHCYDGPLCRFSHEKLTPEMEEVLQKALNSSRDEGTDLQPDGRVQPENVQLPRLYGSDDTSHNVKIDINPEWGRPHPSVMRQLIVVPERTVLLPYPEKDVPAHLPSRLAGTRLPQVTQDDTREYQQQSDNWGYENRDNAWAGQEEESKEFGRSEEYGYQLESSERWEEGQHPNDWVPQRPSPPMEEGRPHPQDWAPRGPPPIEDDVRMKERHPNDWIPQRPLITEEPVGHKPKHPNDWISQRQPDPRQDERGREGRPRRRSPLLDSNGEPTRPHPNDWVPRREVREHHNPRPQFDLDELPADFDSHPAKKQRVEQKGQFTENVLGLVLGQVRSLAGESQENMGMMPLDSQMRHPTETDLRANAFVEPTPYSQDGQRPPPFVEDPVREQANFLPLSNLGDERNYEEYGQVANRETVNRMEPHYEPAERPMGGYINERPRERFTPPSPPPRRYDRDAGDRQMGGYVDEPLGDNFSPPLPIEDGREREEIPVGRYATERPRDSLSPSRAPPSSRGYSREADERPMGQYLDERPRDQFSPPAVTHPSRGYDREVAERPMVGYMNDRPRERISPQRLYETEKQFRDDRDPEFEREFHGMINGRNQRPTEPVTHPEERYNIRDNRGPEQAGFVHEEPRRPNQYEMAPQSIRRDMGQVRMGEGERQLPSHGEPMQPLLERPVDVPFNRVAREELKYEGPRREDVRDPRYQPQGKDEVGYGYSSIRQETRDQPQLQFAGDRLPGYPDKRRIENPEWDRRPADGPPPQFQHPNTRDITEQTSSRFPEPSHDPRFVDASVHYQLHQKPVTRVQYVTSPVEDYGRHYAPPAARSPPGPPMPEPVIISEPVIASQMLARQQPRGPESTIQVSRDPRQRGRIQQPEKRPQQDITSIRDPRKQDSPFRVPTATVLDIKMEMPPPKANGTAAKTMALSSKEQSKKPSLADLFKSIDPTASPFG